MKPFAQVRPSYRNRANERTSNCKWTDMTLHQESLAMAQFSEGKLTLTKLEGHLSA